MDDSLRACEPESVRGLAAAAGRDRGPGTLSGLPHGTAAAGASDPMTTGAAAASRAPSLARVARGSAINLVGAGVSAVANFALTLVVTHGVSGSVAGVFFATSSLFLIVVSLGQLGSDTGLVYFIARARADGDGAWARPYLRTAVGPVVTTGVVAACAVFTFARPLAELTNPGHVELATAYLRAMAVAIPLTLFEQVNLSATRGIGTMRPNALVEQIGRPLLQLALVVVAVSVGGASLLLPAWCLSYVPAAVAAWLWCRRLTRPSNMGNHSRRALTVDRSAFWRFSGPRAMTSIIQVAMQRLDIILVGALAGAVNAAVYAAATRFVVAGQLGSNAISLAAQPGLAISLAREDRHATNNIYQTATAWMILVTWPLYLIFVVFAHRLVLAFGAGYAGGAVVLVLLSIAMLIATGTGMVDQVLSMAGHTSWNLANAIVAVAIMLALDIWLIPRQAVLGAAIGWGVAIVVRNLAALSLVAGVLRLHPIGGITITAAGLATVGYGVVPWAIRTVVGDGLTALFMSVVLGTVVYLPTLWCMRHRLHLDGLLSSLSRRGRT